MMVAATDHDESMASSSMISTMHPEIIQTHILTRLDAATLATAASVSSHLRRLCTDDSIWRDICTATWPSLADPIAGDAISTFPGGHFSIFSDAFPALHHLSENSKRPSPPPPPPPELISAVDIYYEGKPVFSRVRRTETKQNWFLSLPLFVEVLEPNELVPTPVKFVRKDEEWLRHLEESLGLSWVLIDPTRKRAANVSSMRPVSVRRHWLTRDVEAVFAVVMAGERRRETEKVQCVVKVTCCGRPVNGELHVRAVNLVMENTEGGHVSGKEGVAILQRAMETGERKRVNGNANIMKERFEEFTCLTRERRESKHRRQKARDAVSMLLAFFACVLFSFLAAS